MILEVHLVPTAGRRRIEVRRLRQLRDELADLGRAAGVFTVTQQLNVRATAELALAETVVQRDVVDTGLVVRREGQRGAWVSLPTDGLGSVFDSVKAQPRVEALLKALLGIDLAEPEHFAVTAGLARPMILVVGNSDVVGRRNSAPMRLNDQDIRVTPDDDLSVTALKGNTADVAEELIARLMAQVGWRPLATAR